VWANTEWEPRHDFCAVGLFFERKPVANPYEKAYALIMKPMNASEAREKLYRLLDETDAAHEPILITGRRSNAVLIGEEDWNAIQETLYLLSIPGMRESLRQGLKTPVKECKKEPGW
jgi:antitoxin YefM